MPKYMKVFQIVFKILQFYYISFNKCFRPEHSSSKRFCYYSFVIVTALIRELH